MRSKTKLGLTLLATFIGLAVLVLYTTLVQDVLFKEVSFCNASRVQLIYKVMAIGSAGLVTGFLASILVLQDNYYPNIILSIAIVVKAVFLVGCESGSGPFWYEALLSSVLLSGLWIGYYGGVKFPLSPA